MRLIKLQDKFILVSDEEIKEGDNYIVPHNVEGHILSNIWVLCVANKNFILNYYMKEMKNWWFKVISENPDFSLLSEEDCKTIGWVDVEKLADEYASKLYYPVGNSESELNWVNNNKELIKVGFIEGFQTAQSLNDKMFSLEQVMKVIDMARETENFNGLFPLKYTPSSIIQSLQQNVWDVEVEMEKYPCDTKGNEILWSQPINYGGSEDIRNNIYTFNEQEMTDNINFVKAFDKQRPKITNNSIKITKIL